MRRCWSLLLSLLAVQQAVASVVAKNDHVVWIGNTFVERMQYFGEVESRLHARYPEHQLVVRNLGWPADTVSLRPRPKNFGDLHHYLGEMKADVILACFGFNETWDYEGREGLDRFRADLAGFLESLKSRKFNGESAPKVVLYSPVACSKKFGADRDERNQLLKQYAKVMEEVAGSLKVPFVDLFGPSDSLWRSGDETINGVHLTAEGYAKLAPAILPPGLFKPLDQEVPLDEIRREVLEKNGTFFDWYRTVNSFYIHGDRKAPYGTVNFPLERKKLLQMTDLRDQRIWATARGEKLPAEIDDSSTVEIPATLPGSRGGTSPALPSAEERTKFEVAEGFEVKLFASEEDFPELRNPVDMSFDAEGRLWIATMPSYPHALPGVKPNDQILIFEDTDQDGKADKRTVFAEGLYLPLGFEFWQDGLLVSQEPNLVYLEDTDGDGKADKETILLHGFGCEDSHHAIHMFTWGPGGGLYMQESVFGNTQVETINGPVRNKDNGVYRYDPRTQSLQLVSRLSPGGNPWGHAIDRWGDHLYIGCHLNAALVNRPPGGSLSKPPYKNRDTRNCGQEFISSRHWPEHLQGKVFSNQYKNFQGVLVHNWEENGSSFNHEKLQPLFRSSHGACIPVDLQLGPDGALYVLDWYNPVLGHMQYSLRDERRDSKMGRIWRITWKGRPLDTPPRIAGASVEELLDHLKADEDRTRYRARRELWKLSDEKLKPSLEKWLAGMNETEPDHAHHLTEALWLHQQRGWVNVELFEQVATSADHRARAAAAHLLRFWGKELPDVKAIYLRLAADKHAKVRMEAVVSSTWHDDPSVAIEVIDVVGESPQDEHLKIALGNARKAMASALESHPMVIPVDQLAGMPVTEKVRRAIIRRPNLPEELRRKILKDSPEQTLVGIILQCVEREEDSLGEWLEVLDASAIESPDVLKPLLKSKAPRVRQAGYAGLIRAGQLKTIPNDPDAFLAISRLAKPEWSRLFLNPAKDVLSESSDGSLKRAALFALGRVPGNDGELFQLISSSLSDPQLAAASAEALLARKEPTWPEAGCREVLSKHLPKLAAIPVEQRGEDRFVQCSSLLARIARKLNDTAALKEVVALEPDVVEIGTIPDHLKFDRESLHVQPGRPVELRFLNHDSMMHNLVICAPGSLKKVGLAVDALVADPESEKSDWIPEMPEVLHATPMARGFQTVSVRFMAPEKPGTYPFLCTVPGHWRVMKGELVVSDKVAKKKVLILTGEPEYGTRDTLPALAKTLEESHGLEMTHLQVQQKNGQHSFPDLNKHLPEADLMILSIRFLNLVRSDYEAINSHLANKPFIAVRTSNHGFLFTEASGLADENKAMPVRHFGTPYRGHTGHQSSQMNYVMAANHPVMRGIAPRFWTPDFLYAVNPLGVDCTPLMIGQALNGKERATFKEVSPGNHMHVISDGDRGRVTGSPHPVVYTIDNKEGRRALYSTIGARGSFKDTNVQRLFANAILWCLERPVPEILGER